MIRRTTMPQCLPAVGFVTEPLPQSGAGRDILHPQIERRVRFLNAAWPEPIDQYARTILHSRWFVGTLQFDVDRKDCFSHRHSSVTVLRRPKCHVQTGRSLLWSKDLRAFLAR